MQGYKGLINTYFRRLNAFHSVWPAVDHMLVTDCSVQGSLNYRRIFHLHISLVELCRTCMLIYLLMHLDKGWWAKDETSGLYFSKTPVFRKQTAISTVTNVPLRNAYYSSDSWQVNYTSFHKTRKALLSPKTGLLIIQHGYSRHNQKLCL